MSKKSREELANRYIGLSLFDEEKMEKIAFYNLSHDKKADPSVFESFCQEHGGNAAIVLSDDEICDNKELVLIASHYYFTQNYHLLSSRLLNDPEIALALAECNKYEYTNINKALRDDVDLMVKAVQINPRIICSLPSKVKADRRIALEVAKNNTNDLHYLKMINKKDREAIFSDKEIALHVAKYDLDLLCDLFSPELINDPEILEKAFHSSNPVRFKKLLIKYPKVLRSLDLQFWVNDMDLVQQALKKDGHIFERLPEQYRDSKNLALLAVRSYPYALEYCSERLRNDEEIVRLALQDETEFILSFASERLRDNFQLVLYAVSIDGLNLYYASDRLRDNREIVLHAIQNYEGAFDYASERLKLDEEFIRMTADYYSSIEE